MLERVLILWLFRTCSLTIAVTCATCQGVEKTEEIWNFWNFVVWATEHSLLPHDIPLGMVSNIMSA